MRMFKALAIIAACLFAAPALAQSPSGAESRSAFQAFVATEFPDNTSGQITPLAL